MLLLAWAFGTAYAQDDGAPEDTVADDQLTQVLDALDAGVPGADVDVTALPDLPEPEVEGFGAYVIRAISDKGRFPWHQGYAFVREEGDGIATGVLRPIVYKGVTFAKPYASGDERYRMPHCVGATFEAFLDAYTAYSADTGKPFLNDISRNQFLTLYRNWFVVNPATNADGSAGAISLAGLGQRVMGGIEDAQPGDFVQWTEGQGGHSVIFYGWSDAEHTQFAYWAANGRRGAVLPAGNDKTGIGLYQGSVAGLSAKSATYVGRVTPP